jgi:hypothetical protein
LQLASLQAAERVAIGTKAHSDDGQSIDYGSINNHVTNSHQSGDRQALILDEAMTSEDRVPVKLYIRPGLVILGMLAVLVAGILCRIYIPSPAHHGSGEPCNNTTLVNGTAEYVMSHMNYTDCVMYHSNSTS